MIRNWDGLLPRLHPQSTSGGLSGLTPISSTLRSSLMVLSVCRAAADPGSGLPANTRRAAHRCGTALQECRARRWRIRGCPGSSAVQGACRRWRYGQNLGLFGTTIKATQDAMEYLHNLESSSDTKERIILHRIGKSVTFYERIHGKNPPGPEFPKRNPYNF